MRYLWCVASKELRSYFNSAVAFIFLGAFLAISLVTFFWYDPFFVRNIADVRPLFTHLPLLLIFLVAALTMRLWSEEQKLGTLEVLLTLPVRVDTLVLGKFVAGLILVALALAMTLGIPITVSMMGDLDWGPVFGAYFAALLVASAYLSVGLCISSTTDNQIVALIFTWVACGILYVPGADFFVGLWGTSGAELSRALGTGSRFDSIARGVLDLRDLLYYVSIVVVFLVINMALLAAKRWSAGRRTSELRFHTKLAVVLCLMNAVVLNILFSNVSATRIDLTERGEYSISPATKEILGSLGEPLLIRGYFSDRTHPLLDPLIPQIRDRLTEYGVVGGSQVQVEFLDPRTDEEIEREAQEEYGIKSVPFRISDRHQDAVVNSYFHILLKYGDQHETLSFDDLIEINVSGDRSIDVRLRNLEYDVTRAIKKVVSGFQSIDSLFASFASKIELTLYVTPETLPEDWRPVPDRIAKVAKEFESQSAGKFVLNTVMPTTPEAQEKLFSDYGFRPFAASLFSNEVFYLHILLKMGDRLERVLPAREMGEADIRDAIEAALKRGAPGFLKKLGLVTPKAPPQPPPQFAGMGMPPPQVLKYDMLQGKLGENYEVSDVDLAGDDGVPGDVDVLLVIGPEDFADKEQRALDQFLMRGGSAIVLAGRYKFILGRELAVAEVTTGLEDVLNSYGVDIEKALVLDAQGSRAFPVPVIVDRGGFQFREIELRPYLPFVDVRKDGMSEEHVALGGLPAINMQFVSPVREAAIAPANGDSDGESDGDSAATLATVSRQVLLSSSARSWLQTNTNVQPDFGLYQEFGFARPESAGEGAYPLAVALTGVFDSHFRNQAGKPPAGAGEGAQDSAQRPERLIQRSPPGTRLVVVGSSNFVADEVLGLARQTGGEAYLNNLQFVENMIDWMVEDIDLLSIRSRGSYTRTLHLEPYSAETWEWINYAIAAVALVIVVLVNGARRRSAVPLALVSRDSLPSLAPSAKGAAEKTAPTKSAPTSSKGKKGKSKS